MSTTVAVQELHDRCAIYTSPDTASRLLDIVGWTEDVDLTLGVLLEPCVGEGAILAEGVRRLVQSFRRLRRHLAVKSLKPRIKGYELHPGAARQARRNIQHLLIKEGIQWDAAAALASAWIIEADFLLTTPGKATHIAANPPYVRWTRVPGKLAQVYRERLPAMATRGDLAVAFLYRMRDWCRADGRIVALISDRWMFAQYGAEFVEDLAKGGWSLEVADERPDRPFVRNVGAYSAIVRLGRGTVLNSSSANSPRAAAKKRHSRLLAKFGSLIDAGCKVRVGPALGAGRTFILDDDGSTPVEPELIRSLISKSDLGPSRVRTPTHRVVVPYDSSGELIDPTVFPRFSEWASQREDILRKRSQFLESDDWWRTIDAVPAIWSNTPKLLLPEVCRTPTAILDETSALPSHSIYAIWPGPWPLKALQRVLNAGLLELTARAEAPALKHGWIRFYKRFIVRTPLPKWEDLSADDRSGLRGQKADFDATFQRVFGFRVGHPFDE